MKKLVIAALAALMIGSAAAEQQFGVEVYPGAKPNPDVTKFLKESFKMNGHAYTTSDSVEKVTAYYQKQPGLKQNPGADKTQSGFMGKGVMVTVQNPWLDMKTSKKMDNTLVSIVKQ